MQESIDDATVPSFNHKMDAVARYMSLIAIFSLPFSATLYSLYTPAAIFSLLGGNIRTKFAITFQYSMNWIALILIFLFAIGIIYNPISTHLALKVFWKYTHRFFAVIFLIPLFIEKKWRQRAINTLIITTLFAIFGYIISYLNIWCWNCQMGLGNLGQFYPRIPFSILCAFVAFVLLHKMSRSSNYRIMYGLGFLLNFSFLYFINNERTGMLVFLCLFILFFYQRWGGKAIFAGLFSCFLIASALYYISPNVHQRSNEAIHNLIHYNKATNSPIGLRITLTKYSWDLIKKKPVFGYGTGLFSDPVGIKPPSTNLNNYNTIPENSYLHIALQIGLVGLMVYLLWIASQFYMAKNLYSEDKIYAQGLILTISVANLFAPIFLIGLTANFYLLFLAIFAGGRKSVADSALLKTKNDTLNFVIATKID